MRDHDALDEVITMAGMRKIVGRVLQLLSGERLFQLQQSGPVRSPNETPIFWRLEIAVGMCKQVRVIRDRRTRFLTQKAIPPTLSELGVGVRVDGGTRNDRRCGSLSAAD